jgi:hypothetical protein
MPAGAPARIWRTAVDLFPDAIKLVVPDSHVADMGAIADRNKVASSEDGAQW